MSSPTSEREARLLLNMAGEPGHARLAHLFSELGPMELVADLRSGRAEGSEELAHRLNAIDPTSTLRVAARTGLRFVIPGDEEWPASLDELQLAPSIHDRAGPPVGIWLRGPAHLREICEGSVAIVGSRSATTYGTRVASDIGSGCAEAGHTVISGGAFGIDQAAHRGALARGRTVAVLACGADRTYPKTSHDLIEHIARTSLVISEAPLGGEPFKVRFLARNRLIAALTTGTVVVEAARRSGALNTATWANHLGRTLMGVPGPVTSATSAGVHELIRSRAALLVTRPADVVEAVSGLELGAVS
ncbi:MAG TPA: DNA-processing protein DprA [Marmoricola sp.]|nr:DNA-processing protein DprA [Marmoricola sp.]